MSGFSNAPSTCRLCERASADREAFWAEIASELHWFRKWDQVLDGARTVFMRDGFEGASVDDIVRQAGVSKATLYSYFPDKRLLFLEVAKIECAAQSDAAIAQVEASGDLREALTTAASRMVRFFMSDVGMQVYRIVVGESQRFPEIGREFYETGPAPASAPRTTRACRTWGSAA